MHTDYLGTPRVVTSGLNGGSVVWEWKNYNPYGYNEAQGSIEFNLRFAGQYYDAESGLHYNMFRTYNPEIGRYMQSDPIGLSGGFNTYNYVNKNPLDGVDPLGLWGTKAHNAIIDAFIKKYMPEIVGEYGYIDKIKKGSRFADSWKYQGAEYSYMHAMSSDVLNKTQSKEMYCIYVNAYLNVYKQMLKSDKGQAYFYLGMALHAVMDSTSPAHAGFQKWDWTSTTPLHHGDFNWNSYENVINLEDMNKIQPTINLMNKTLNSGCSCQ